MILEVLDARDPLGCRCPQVEQAVIQSGTNKKIVLVLNKIGKKGRKKVAQSSANFVESFTVYFDYRFGVKGNCGEMD